MTLTILLYALFLLLVVVLLLMVCLVLEIRRDLTDYSQGFEQVRRRSQKYIDK